jgi:hypothetical protein
VKTHKYRPPPLRPPKAEAVPPPPGPWQPFQRHWLDVIDVFDRVITSCDGWASLLSLARTGPRFLPGHYRVIDGSGAMVGYVIVSARGEWRIERDSPWRCPRNGAEIR